MRDAACACGSALAEHPTPECSEAHVASEFDPQGHAGRVAANFSPGSVEHEVALYHDHIEDDLGPVPDAIRGHVVVLTRRKGETYTDYIERVAASSDPVAIAVKLADARDNLARCRGEFDGYVNSNLARRYEYVLRRLGSERGGAVTSPAHAPGAASLHPCPKGNNCALNSGAIHCFHCRRNWPRDETWDVPFEQRPDRRSPDAAWRQR